MKVEQLYLKNFRNYDDLSLNFQQNINVFIGKNAQGKTNILEAILFSSLGNSHRTSNEKEMIKWHEQNTYIKTNFSSNYTNQQIDIKIGIDGKKKCARMT